MECELVVDRVSRIVTVDVDVCLAGGVELGCEEQVVAHTGYRQAGNQQEGCRAEDQLGSLFHNRIVAGEDAVRVGMLCFREVCIRLLRCKYTSFASIAVMFPPLFPTH